MQDDTSGNVCSKAQNNGNHIERSFSNLVAIEEGMQVWTFGQFWQVWQLWADCPVNSWDLHVLDDGAQSPKVGLLDRVIGRDNFSSVVSFGDVPLCISCHIEKLLRHCLYLSTEALLESSQRVA